FSQINTTGSCHNTAMLKVSCKSPCLAAPSPKKQSVTRSLLRYWSEKAIPAPSPICPPTIPCPPKNLFSFEKKCIEPPFPLEQSVTFPQCSAIHSLGDMPLAIADPWSR